MRLVPVLLAVLVTAFLFALVLHRDALLAIAGNEPADAATPEAAPSGPEPVRVVALS